jgi:hypothetical protein
MQVQATYGAIQRIRALVCLNLAGHVEEALRFVRIVVLRLCFPVHAPP